jgi:hypothetical protein
MWAVQLHHAAVDGGADDFKYRRIIDACGGLLGQRKCPQHSDIVAGGVDDFASQPIAERGGQLDVVGEALPQRGPFGRCCDTMRGQRLHVGHVLVEGVVVHPLVLLAG